MSNACPACGKKYSLPAGSVGRAFVCKRCGLKLQITDRGLTIPTVGETGPPILPPVPVNHVPVANSANSQSMDRRPSDEPSQRGALAPRPLPQPSRPAASASPPMPDPSAYDYNSPTPGYPAAPSPPALPPAEYDAEPVDFEEEEDEEPRRRRRSRRKYDDTPLDEDEDLPPRKGSAGSTFVTALQILSMVAWGLLLLTIGLGAILFVVALKDSKSVIEEASIAAIFSAAFIGLYVIVRCIEKFVASLERLLSK